MPKHTDLTASLRCYFARLEQSLPISFRRSCLNGSSAHTHTHTHTPQPPSLPLRTAMSERKKPPSSGQLDSCWDHKLDGKQRKGSAFQLRLTETQLSRQDPLTHGWWWVCVCV